MIAYNIKLLITVVKYSIVHAQGLEYNSLVWITVVKSFMSRLAYSITEIITVVKCFMAEPQGLGSKDL